MNRYIVHLNYKPTFSVRANSIYDVEQYVRDNFTRKGYCITALD